MTNGQIDKLGTKLGPRILQLLVDGTIDVRRKMLPVTSDLGMHIFNNITHLIGSEVNATLGDVIKELDDPDAPQWLRNMVRQTAQSKGQFFTIVGMTAGASGFTSALGTIMNNFMYPSVRNIVGLRPVLPLAVDTLAQLRARGLDTAPTQSRGDHRGQGIDDERFARLVALNHAIPDVSSVLEMWRRGITSESQARDWLRHIGYQPDTIDDILALRLILPTPQTLAEAWARGAISQTDARSAAAKQGVDTNHFRLLEELAGQPLAPQDLLTAFRRGLIDESRLNRGIVQGPLRNEWFDVLRDLQYSPMTTSDALDAVNQNLLSESEGRRIAEENGLLARDFGVMVKAAGLPMSPTDTFDAWNRGDMTEAQVRQSLLESRLKNRYVPVLMAQRFKLLPPETIGVMVASRALTPEEGMRRLRMFGYDAETADAVVWHRTQQRTEPERDLTKSEIVALYKAQALARADAAELLSGMGYDADETALILDLVDLQRLRAALERAISTTRSRYIAWDIARGDASIQLDRIGLPAAQRDDLLAVWDQEREITVRRLTPAEIRSAVKKGVRDAAWARERLAQHGFPAEDAEIYLQL